MMDEPEMIEIPAGPVVLGEPEFPSGSKLPHSWVRRKVRVPAFAVARYAVTVGQYLAFAEESGYAIDNQLRTDRRFADLNAPAAYVSWIDAVRYTQWLSRRTGKPYRLLRDAEYEKAARGGLVGKPFPWGDDDPAGRADFNNAQGAPQPVGLFEPNGYGLHDMAGSLWCWCEECYEQVAGHDKAQMCYDDTRLRDVRLNPICRGGSFKTADPVVLYCAYRHEDPLEGRFDCIGFRVAISL